MKKYSWTYKAGLILAVLFVIWIAAALLLNTASAQGLPLSLRLSSRLSADYSVDDIGPLKALSLSIIGDMLRDMGMAPEEAEDHESAMKALMDDPVPTATALDFEGAAPFTATPTNTAIPTNTPTSTSTPTSTITPRPTRTRTPKPTDTPNPTNTGVAATATSAGSDTTPPSITTLVLSPPDGSILLTCSFDVVSMQVFDPAVSSGFAPADVLVKHERHSGGYYFQQVPYISGGFVSGLGSDWDATYGGPMILSDVEVGDVFKVYGKVQDLAGTGWVISSAHTYTYNGAADCP